MQEYGAGDGKTVSKPRRGQRVRQSVGDYIKRGQRVRHVPTDKPCVVTETAHWILGPDKRLPDWAIVDFGDGEPVKVKLSELEEMKNE